MIIDLSHEITETLPVYPGDDKVQLIQTKFFERDHYCNHQLNIGMHSGTHIDGPMHLTESTKSLSDFPIETFIGEGCLFDVSKESIIDYKEEYEKRIGENQIVLLHTAHSELFGRPEYFLNYPTITYEFAKLLVRKGVKMIGLDTPSPDEIPFDIHKYLFQNNILIIENLTNLEKLIDVENFDVIALPLKIRADSSIARVIARTMD